MAEIKDYLMIGLEFTPAVVGFIVRDNQVLLGLRKKVSLGLGENLISGIGGKIGDNPQIAKESPAEALVREFEEEIEVVPETIEDFGKVQFIFPHKPKWNQSVYVYRITSWQGQPGETEVIKPMWFDVKSLPTERMWKDNAYWVPKVLKGERVNMVFLYDEKNNISEFIDYDQKTI